MATSLVECKVCTACGMTLADAAIYIERIRHGTAATDTELPCHLQNAQEFNH